MNTITDRTAQAIEDLRGILKACFILRENLNKNYKAIGRCEYPDLFSKIGRLEVVLLEEIEKLNEEAKNNPQKAQNQLKTHRKPVKKLPNTHRKKP